MKYNLAQIACWVGACRAATKKVLQRQGLPGREEGGGKGGREGRRGADPAPKPLGAASRARQSRGLRTRCFIAKSTATVTAGRNLPIETFSTGRKWNFS